MSDSDKPAVIEMWRTCRLQGEDFFTSAVRMEAWQSGKEYHSVEVERSGVPRCKRWILAENCMFFELEDGARHEIGRLDRVQYFCSPSALQPKIQLVEFWSKSQDSANDVRSALGLAYRIGFSEGEESMKQQVLSNLFGKK